MSSLFSKNKQKKKRSHSQNVRRNKHIKKPATRKQKADDSNSWWPRRTGLLGAPWGQYFTTRQTWNLEITRHVSRSIPTDRQTNRLTRQSRVAIFSLFVFSSSNLLFFFFFLLRSVLLFTFSPCLRLLAPSGPQTPRLKATYSNLIK